VGQGFRRLCGRLVFSYTTRVPDQPTTEHPRTVYLTFLPSAPPNTPSALHSQGRPRVTKQLCLCLSRGLAGAAPFTPFFFPEPGLPCSFLGTQPKGCPGPLHLTTRSYPDTKKL
jgi:hypothetical protein